MKRHLLILQILFIGFYATVNKAEANHIVGGELKMSPAGNNIFNISLIQFWDQNSLVIPSGPNNGNRDQSATLYIYRKKDDKMMGQLSVVYQSTTAINYQNRACATIRSLQTVTGVYTGQVTLSPDIYNDSEGYYLLWERCCRNNDINNIRDPGDNGMVFYLEFPPVTVVDSSPEFQIPNGEYICSNKPFSMNMSATDADGDELRYSLVTPLRGNTTPNSPLGDNTKKNGYPAVSWSNGISLANVIPGSKPLAVNKSGILQVTASDIGLYVFTVQCEEFRNGKRIGLVRRDFQLLVIDCANETPEQPVVMYQAQPIEELSFCPEKPLELETQSVLDCSYQWQLNGLNIPGATNVNIMVQDTGNYSVVKSFNKKCSRDTASTNVHVAYQAPPEALITADRQIICEGEVASLLANGGILKENLICSWTMDEVSLSTDPKMEAKTPGQYKLLVTDSVKGCSSVDSLTITVDKIGVVLPESVSLSEGSSMMLLPEINPDSTNTYQWAPPEGIIGDAAKRDIKIAPVESTDYTIVVTTDNGCKVSALIHVNVIEKLHIPAAFSPNNDGTNDYFEIFNSKDQIKEISIYNRWGEVIFSSEGYKIPWNGTYKDKPVPAGTYPYIIKMSDKSLTGEILLLR